MRRHDRIAALLLAIAAWVGAPAAGADADMTIAQLKRPTPVSAYGGRVVWSAFDFDVGRYRLMTQVDGVTVRVPVAPRSSPFDADLGPDSHGRPTAVYSRCRRQPGGRATINGCDLYRFDFASGRERRIAGASRSDASEYLPSLWRGRLAFTRVDERHPRSLRRLYIRSLSDGREELVPGGSPTGDRERAAGPAGLDLNGRRLAYLWVFTSHPMLENGPSSEVRVSTAGGRSILLSRRYNPDGIVSRVLSVPSLVDGSVYYALMTEGDSNGHRFHRSDLPGGRRFHGPRDSRIMVATATDATATYGVLKVLICREPNIVCTGDSSEEPRRAGYELVLLDAVTFAPGFSSGP